MENLNIKNISKLKVSELKKLVPYGINIKNKKKSELINIINSNLPEIIEGQRINSMSKLEFLKYIYGELK